ncbi:MAG: SpoIIE family protein phosphatase, partial [Candidatus Cloacimonadota bacterium]|nr:SpoIIE family protein phosphatase [Candidatus Cloacimonadota bacterium]
MNSSEKFKIKKPISRKLILRICIPLLVVYMAILFLFYSSAKKDALKQTKKYLIELTAHYATELNSRFIQIAQAPKSIAQTIQTFPYPNSAQIKSILNQKLESDSTIFGMAVAFEPYYFSKYQKLYAPYSYRMNGKIIFKNLEEKLNYFPKDWYNIPKLLDASYWGEPYYDEGGGNILMNTFSTPIYSKGKLVGVATADMSLELLEKRMDNIKIMDGYTFIISKHGTYIYHPNKKDIMSESIFSKAEKYNFPQMRKFGREMLKGKSAVESFPDPITNSKKWLVYTPIKSNGWTLAVVIPEKTILTSVNSTILRQAFLMLIGLLVILGVIIWASFGITKPIAKLVVMAKKIADGNLDVQLKDIKGEDEIHELAVVFNKMIIDLNHYINDLTKATRAKQAVESELKIARQIQESLLPRIFPAFPNRKEFDLYARNIPAKEVAGDFYDFFFLDDDHLAFIIADVSGKGISAGLFMAVTRTLLKTVCQKGVEPSDALERANIILSQENDACMFTTLFLGIYDVRTGDFSYANAGHDEPIIMPPNRNLRIIPTLKNIALGLYESHKFNQETDHLDKDDIVVLYTDGVIEATSKENELYGEERF